jgi:amino-acid N-acetyltransferase
MNIFARPAEPATRAVLSACGLPTEDLGEQNFEHFFGCGQTDAPTGVVGLELHGSVALLRSLAVNQVVRGKGCGKALVQSAEAHARSSGVSELYLLTNTAKQFFESLGYHEMERTLAPAAIKETKEFASICPGSATFMRKRL